MSTSADQDNILFDKYYTMEQAARLFHPSGSILLLRQWLKRNKISTVWLGDQEGIVKEALDIYLGIKRKPQ